MNERELYRQKKQAQLDEWSAEIQKIKARASKAGADAQLKIDKQVAALEKRIQEGKLELSQLGTASEEAWGSLKTGIEEAWGSMKSAVQDASSKLKEREKV